MNRNLRSSLSFRKKVGQIALWIILLLGSLTMIIPFWWMISTSFDNSALFRMPVRPQLWPLQPSVDNYKLAFTNIPMMRYIGNTLLVAVITILISLTSALMAGYSLSKIRFKGYNVVLILCLSTMMIPGEVTMVPRFFLFYKLGLADSYGAFWLPAVVYVFGAFLIKQTLDGLPDSLRESARIDGAGDFTILARIYAPLCSSVLATLTVLQFLASWNDFLWPLIILSSPSKYTLQLGVALFSFNQGLSQMPSIRMATTVISILPVLTLYLFAQRYIVESIALTGLKQ